jgi:hypothetical protein
MLITFFVSSIWHKPTFVFLIWGVLASLLILVEKKSGITKYQRYFGVPLVLVFTSLLWNFFQIDDISTFMSKGIQFQSCVSSAYPGLFVTCVIAFTLSVFCDIQTRLIENKPYYFAMPLFLVNIGLLLVLWPSRITLNSVYGF